ncbi:MAG: hypothetical protein L0210_05125 [Rhodospirillales bacterium]|nr:hypothetical protein [Rhodospirillales bacterium]
MGVRRVEHLWAALEAAGQFDASVRLERRAFSKMLERYVPPIPYTRATLFGRMLAGEISILTGFPAPLRHPLRDLPPAEAGRALVRWLATRRNPEMHRVYTGPTGMRRHLTLRDIALKWRANRTRFGVTDLHIRGTMMEDVIAPDVISGFNLLPHSSVGAREQEMFSFVISSRGHVTDSHSDAPDSSNFCFVGKKLWLAWDTYEGMRRGLQDVERVPVYRNARFDMTEWLRLRSARWFLVNSGETLFLPAHLTHKVITLEPYIGVGGFFIALPNSLRLLSHWIVRGPLWSKRDSTGDRDGILGEIAQSVHDAVLALQEASLKERQRWGYDYLKRAAAYFIKTCPSSQFRTLWADPRFRCVADVMHVPSPLPAGRNGGSA